MRRVDQYLARLLDFSFATAWRVYLLLLPITSLPILSEKIGHTLVAPASLIPLMWLSIWLANYLIKGGRVPRESCPLLFFGSVALLSSAMAVFLAIPSYKGKTIWSEEATALATLALGVVFYLVTASWLLQKPAWLSPTLRWVSLGGALALVWAIVQAIYIFLLNSRFPHSLLVFHRFFSIRDFSLTRITAFAYEPSWLAHQLNILYLPLWLSATLQGWSAFPVRLGRLSIENILLGVGGTIVLLSSRIGALSFLLVVLIVVIHYTLALAHKAQRWISRRLVFQSLRLRNISLRSMGLVLTISLLGLYLILALGVLYGLAQIDPRLERLVYLPNWIRQQLPSLHPFLVFRYLAFAERYVYWATGWRVFSLYPILGVGLGNAGFFFPSLLPTYGLNLVEVTESLYFLPYLPNIKSFWIRLLAETGIVGFSAFLAWYLVTWTSARFLRHESKPLYRMVGWAGLFVLVAFLTEGFSVDTFALPYLWTSLGIVSAAAAIARQETSIDSRHLQNPIGRRLSMLSLSPKGYLKQVQQYAQASWRWKSLKFDSPPIFGNARAKSGSHLLLQVLHGIWQALPYAYVRSSPIREITAYGRHCSSQEVLHELAQIRPGVIGWGYLPPKEEYIRVLCGSGRVNYFIYRDPRDQLISHIFYAVDMHEGHRLRAYYLRLPNMDARITATIKGIDEPGFEYPNVRALYEGVFQWLEQPGVMAIRFEELRHSPQSVIKNMLELIKNNGLALPLPENLLIDIILKAIQPTKSPTFRQGKSGSWREYFNDEHKRLFKEIAGDVLIRLGYEKDYNW